MLQAPVVVDTPAITSETADDVTALLDALSLTQTSQTSQTAVSALENSSLAQRIVVDAAEIVRTKPEVSPTQETFEGASIVSCPGHQKPCHVKTGVTNGPNRGKHFHVCPFRGSKDDCGFVKPAPRSEMLLTGCPLHVGSAVELQSHHINAKGITTIKFRCETSRKSLFSGTGWCGEKVVLAQKPQPATMPSRDDDLQSRTDIIADAYAQPSLKYQIPKGTSDADESELQRLRRLLASGYAKTCADHGAKIRARISALEMADFQQRAKSVKGVVMLKEDVTTPDEIRLKKLREKQIAESDFTQEDLRCLKTMIKQAAAILEPPNAAIALLTDAISQSLQLSKDPIMHTTLMPHQVTAVSWMKMRESAEGNRVRGGILADDMGLGKTVSTLALLAMTSPKDVNVGSRSGGTLILCPASLVSQWESEIETHVALPWKIVVWHGAKRTKSIEELQTADVVISTYGTIEAEDRQDHSVVFDMNWTRLVLDEAHVIKNRQAKTTKAVMKLKGACRWLLSGTPVQNDPKEVQSLLEFLRFSPFDQTDVFTRLFKLSPTRLALVLQSVMLRRCKHDKDSEGNARIFLPPKVIETVLVSLNPADTKRYRELELELKKDVLSHTRDLPQASSAFMLQKLLRLRQLCDHSTLLALPDNTDNEPTPPSSEETFERSAKLDLLLKKMQDDLAKDSSTKIVVVSEWTSMLNICAAGLRQLNVGFTRLDGSMGIEQRKTAVAQFRAEKTTCVLLLSLKAGGVGLNLTCANRLYLMEPHWNPQLQNQAFDRIYRLGQLRPVKISIFVCKDTVECNILKLQAQKTAMGAVVVGDDKTGLAPFDLKRMDWEMLFHVDK